jgi:hypothetical protein
MASENDVGIILHLLLLVDAALGLRRHRETKTRRLRRLRMDGAGQQEIL